jgi:hypothetical protein
MAETQLTSNVNSQKDGRLMVSSSTQPISSLNGMISAQKCISLEEMGRAIHRRASNAVRSTAVT